MKGTGPEKNPKVGFELETSILAAPTFSPRDIYYLFLTKFIKMPRHQPGDKFLQTLRCVTPTVGPIYQRGSDNFKICQLCFSKLSAEEQEEYISLSLHHLIHKSSVYNQHAQAVASTS